MTMAPMVILCLPDFSMNPPLDRGGVPFGWTRAMFARRPISGPEVPWLHHGRHRGHRQESERAAALVAKSGARPIHRMFEPGVQVSDRTGGRGGRGPAKAVISLQLQSQMLG